MVLEGRKREGRERATLQSVTVSVTPASLSRGQVGGWLSWREWQVLSYLAGHPDRFVSGDELIHALWGGLADPSVVRVNVGRLRAKLGDSFIETGPEGGYCVSHGKSAGLLRECSRCRRPIPEFEREWVCYGCGLRGRGPEPAIMPRELGLATGRRAYAEGTREGKAWTAEDEAFVAAHVDDMSDGEMGAAMGRTASAVRGYRAVNGIGKRYVRRGRVGLS